VKALPTQPETQNVRVLAQESLEEFTGIATATVTLTNRVLTTVNGIALALVFKNGTLVQPSTYTIAGNVITLGSALTGTDWVVVRYSYTSR